MYSRKKTKKKVDSDDDLEGAAFGQKEEKFGGLD